MKFLKIIFILVISMLLFVVLFYFWGRQSNFSQENYTSIHSKAVQKLSTSDTISVMTYNIGYLSGMTNNIAVERPFELIASNLEKSVLLFSELDPDIAGFQEIDFASKRTYYINQFDSLLFSLNFASGAIAVNWDKKYVPFPYWPFDHHFAKMYSGQAVLSKFGILENDRIVLPQPESNTFYYNAFYLDRLAQISWLDFRGTRLLLINVHFEAWDGPTRERQASIVLDLYREYADSYPVLLMGDFNCTPPFSTNAFSENTIQKILDEPGLEMCMDPENFVNNQTDHYTFNSEMPYNKIDYIFYNSRYFDCINSRVVNEAGEISDHLPVMAKLVYKSQKE